MTITAIQEWRPNATPLSAAEIVGTLDRQGFLEFSVEERVFKKRFIAIKAGMEKITDDPRLQALFPWGSLCFDDYGPGYEQECGLTKRDDDEQKFIFQYSPEANMASGIELDSVLTHFFEALYEIDQEARRLSTIVATCFDVLRRDTPEPLYPMSLMELLRGGRIITSVIRYLTKKIPAPDAKLHHDRSLFTVHWGATHGGLVLISPDGTPHRIQETSMSRVAIFPGRKFAACTRGLLGLGTPHGVRDERTATTRDEDRYSLISFVHPSSNVKDARWIATHQSEFDTAIQAISL